MHEVTSRQRCQISKVLRRMNQETKRVQLEQEEILSSWLRAALVVFRLSLFDQQCKNPLYGIVPKPRFPLRTCHVMTLLGWTMKLQCSYNVWCPSQTRYTLVIWLWQGSLHQYLPSPAISYPDDLGGGKLSVKRITFYVTFPGLSH